MKFGISRFLILQNAALLVTCFVGLLSFIEILAGGDSLAELGLLTLMIGLALSVLVFLSLAGVAFFQWSSIQADRNFRRAFILSCAIYSSCVLIGLIAFGTLVALAAADFPNQ